MIDPKGLLMIEPKQLPTNPVRDRYTKLAAVALRLATRGPIFKGWHTCVCGAKSGNVELRVDGMLTNSLIVHYVRDHRPEVPMSELVKLERFAHD